MTSAARRQRSTLTASIDPSQRVRRRVVDVAPERLAEGRAFVRRGRAGEDEQRQGRND
jgi:hypothetical protein